MDPNDGLLDGCWLQQSIMMVYLYTRKERSEVDAAYIHAAMCVYRKIVDEQHTWQ